MTDPFVFDPQAVYELIGPYSDMPIGEIREGRYVPLNEFQTESWGCGWERAADGSITMVPFEGDVSRIKSDQLFRMRDGEIFKLVKKP